MQYSLNCINKKHMITFIHIKMSEGAEVKIIADKIYDALLNNKSIQCGLSNGFDNNIRNKIIRFSIEYVKTVEKNIIVKFSSGV